MSTVTPATGAPIASLVTSPRPRAARASWVRLVRESPLSGSPVRVRGPVDVHRLLAPRSGVELAEVFNETITRCTDCGQDVDAAETVAHATNCPGPELPAATLPGDTPAQPASQDLACALAFLDRALTSFGHKPSVPTHTDETVRLARVALRGCIRWDRSQGWVLV